MKIPKFFNRKGYTLVEAVAASAMLGAMIGGAISLIGTINLMDRAAMESTVAMNMQDCAGKLWQLGLSPTEVLTVLPTNSNNEFLTTAIVYSGANAVTFPSSSTTVTLSSTMGSLENISCSITVSDEKNLNNQTTTVQLYRPILR